MPTPGKLCPELSLVRGDTTILTFTLTDGTNPINITGYSFAMQLRTSPDAAGSVAFTCAITSGVNGIFTATLAAADAATLTSNTSYYYDVQMTDTASNKTTIISGITQPIIADVTRP
jgi:hypothetical protein